MDIWAFLKVPWANRVLRVVIGRFDKKECQLLMGGPGARLFILTRVNKLNKRVESMRHILDDPCLIYPLIRHPPLCQHAVIVDAHFLLTFLKPNCQEASETCCQGVLLVPCSRMVPGSLMSEIGVLKDVFVRPSAHANYALLRWKKRRPISSLQGCRVRR